MHRACRERFPHHRLLVIPTCITARAVMHAGIINKRFTLKSMAGENVLGIPDACATRNFTYLVRGPWCHYASSRVRMIKCALVIISKIWHKSLGLGKFHVGLIKINAEMALCISSTSDIVCARCNLMLRDKLYCMGPVRRAISGNKLNIASRVYHKYKYRLIFHYSLLQNFTNPSLWHAIWKNESQ